MVVNNTAWRRIITGAWYTTGVSKNSVQNCGRTESAIKRSYLALFLRMGIGGFYFSMEFGAMLQLLCFMDFDVYG